MTGEDSIVKAMVEVARELQVFVKANRDDDEHSRRSCRAPNSCLL